MSSERLRTDSALEFLRLSRYISFDTYKTIIMHLDQQTHFKICCTDFDKKFLVQTYIQKYIIIVKNNKSLKPKISYNESIDYDTSIEYNYNCMLGAFDVFKFQYKQFNTFLNSISSIWYIMNKYTQFTSLGSPIIRIFCDDVLTASCLLYIHSPPLSQCVLKM